MGDGCEPRIKVIVKMQNKSSRMGSGGVGRGVGSGGWM